MYVLRRLHELNLKAIFVVLTNFNISHLKKRDNTRLVHQIAVKGVSHIEEQRQYLDEHTFQCLCVKYYELAFKYCLNKKAIKEVKDAFKEKLDVDIEELSEKISPLGFRFVFVGKKAKMEKNKMKQERRKLRQEKKKEEKNNDSQKAHN